MKDPKCPDARSICETMERTIPGATVNYGVWLLALKEGWVPRKDVRGEYRIFHD